MRIEPCEPCEWVGLDVPAEHHVGWDQTPLCEYHFEVDKQGKLGNWVNENIVFPETDYDPTVVDSGKISIAISSTDLMNSLGIPEELSDTKVDSVLFGFGPREVSSGHILLRPPGAVREPVTDQREILRKLENDAWKYLGRSEGGSLASLSIARYLTDFLTDHDVDTTDLETSLSNL